MPTKPRPRTTRRDERRPQQTQAEPPSQVTVWMARFLVFGLGLVSDRRSRPLDAEVLDDIGLGHLLDGDPNPEAEREQLGLWVARIEGTPACRNHPVFENVEYLGARLGLGALERDVLALAVVMQTETCLPDVLNYTRMGFRRCARLFAKVLGVEAHAIDAVLRSDGMIVSMRLAIVSRRARATIDEFLELMDGLGQILAESHASASALFACFLHAAPAPRLTSANFPHAAHDLGIASALLRGAIDRRLGGVNILLRGAPGVGKTEVARILAANLGLTLYEVNTENALGQARGRKERFAAYSLCQRLLGPVGEALVLFDEIEDVFPRPSTSGLFGDQARSADDEGWVNRLLEGNPVPTLWVSNHVDQMDAAFIRRFEFVMEMRSPPAGVRQQLLAAHVADLDLDPAWVRRAAGDDRLTPAHIERATRVARIVGPGADDTATVLTRVLENSFAVHAGPRRTGLADDSGPTYDPALLNLTHDPTRVVEGLAARPRAAVCLHGPPGTGKTAFVRYAGEAIGRDVHVHRASDLLSRWLGGTEKNLAAMFERARDEGAVLLLDEADSFLNDRAQAVRSWEVTQVNELLVQIEAFEGVLFCATNRLGALDPAALRRFALKIGFAPPDPDQRWRLFLLALSRLGVSTPSGPDAVATRRALDQLDRLTHGDYAAVLRGAAVLGGDWTVRRVLDALADERSAKPESRARPVGFR